MSALITVSRTDSSSKTIYFRKESHLHGTFDDTSFNILGYHYYFYRTITLTHHQHTLRTILRTF
jgi:hypothetical protein